MRSPKDKEIPMENNNWDLWENISFKTTRYSKNFDFITKNENILTDYDVVISKLNIKERQKATIIGEGKFSLINLEIGRRYGFDIPQLIKDYDYEFVYSELYDILEKKQLNLDKHKKILILQRLVVSKPYRGHEITEEYMEMIHRNYYDENTLIVSLVRPFQYDYIINDYYVGENNSNLINGSLFNYFSLDTFSNKRDEETNCYKLFAIANRCGFSRVGDSFLFQYSPKKTQKRMDNKHNINKSNDFFITLMRDDANN